MRAFRTKDRDMDETTSIVHLGELIDDLLPVATASHSGRATHVFRAVPGGSLSQVLLVLRAGETLSEHENPGQALLHVLRGSVQLTAGDDTWDLGPDDYIAIPHHRHHLLASTDSAMFLTVVRERDELVS